MPSRRLIPFILFPAAATVVGILIAPGCGAAGPEPRPSGEEAGPAALRTEAGPDEVAAAPASAPQAPPREKSGRVIILGFDGVEPTIVETMMAAGELPNMKKLSEQGTFKSLRSAIPPQSPSAWSSFSTCKTTGNHGVFDFLKRNPRTYIPDKGFGKAVHAKLAADGSVTKPAYFESYRKGDAFWVVADRQGLACKVLSVPFAFPADDMSHGLMRCGLGVTDLRGTDSSFYSFSDTYTKETLEKGFSGGIPIPLKFENDVAKVKMPGARNPLVASSTDPGGYVEVELEFTVDRAAHALTIKTPMETFELNEGQWSKWLEWTFEVTPKFTVRAISRYYLVEAGEHVKLYMACLQFHPKAPYIRFSTPEAYSGELMDRYGLYKTIGWTYDTHALRQDALTDDAFLEDVMETTAWKARLFLDELGRGQFDLLIGAWTAPDRVSHMFWRFRDPKHPLYTAEGAAKYGRAVESTYLKMDEIVGETMARIGTDDLLMVLSDHGFKSYRKGLNVNTWLIRNGYLAVEGQSDAANASNSKQFLFGYDWSKSKAYSLGLGSIFLNLRGREGRGIVDPEDADALIAEIKSKLLEVADPDTGDKVFTAIYTREDFPGIAEADAPDLQLGYADGYQSSKATVSGSAPPELFDINNDKWSGEHAASDVHTTPGIFFSNKPITRQDPAIIDLGVTALEFLGADVPDDFEGQSLLGG